jgi:hypothetical protein
MNRSCRLLCFYEEEEEDHIIVKTHFATLCVVNFYSKGILTFDFRMGSRFVKHPTEF